MRLASWQLCMNTLNTVSHSVSQSVSQPTSKFHLEVQIHINVPQTAQIVSTAPWLRAPVLDPPIMEPLRKRVRLVVDARAANRFHTVMRSWPTKSEEGRSSTMDGPGIPEELEERKKEPEEKQQSAVVSAAEELEERVRPKPNRTRAKCRNCTGRPGFRHICPWCGMWFCPQCLDRRRHWCKGRRGEPEVVEDSVSEVSRCTSPASAQEVRDSSKHRRQEEEGAPQATKKKTKLVTKTKIFHWATSAHVEITGVSF